MRLNDAKFDKGYELKIAKIIMPLLLSLLIFIMIYPVSMDLPVLGDGCHHAYIMEEIANKQSLDIESKVYYPMFYHLFGAIIYNFLGIDGIKLISPLMMALSGLVVYLIAKKLTKTKFAALLSILLIAFSPKVIWYGVQILIEPFMIFFILLAIYVCLIFYKSQKTRNLLLLSFLLGMAISTKQQTLFLVIALPTFLLINKIELKKIFFVLAIPLLVASGPWLYMYSTTGCLVSPPSDSIVLNSQGKILPKILFGDYEVPEWSKRLEKESGGLSIYQKGVETHECRHIYIWDMLNIDKFYYLNGLYPSNWYGISGQWKTSVYIILKLLFIVGFLLTLIYSFKDSKWRILPCIIFVSWSFTYLGSDTKRYFLYLPIILSLSYFLVIDRILISLKKIKLNAFKIRKFLGFLLIFISITFLIPYSVGMRAQIGAKNLANTQCYSPSRGGVSSIEEVGKWIQENSNESDKIFGTSGIEWKYYSKRKVIADARMYFLPRERIDYWLNYLEIKYVVIRQNQILPDNEWNHLEYYPESFYKKIKEMYPLVYVSSYKDIEVYEVKG